MSDDKVTTWIEMQRHIWDADNSLRAEIICLENTNGDALITWPVQMDNLAEVIKTNLDMQASELPKGMHRLRLVSYSDKTRKNQLNELPQTLRGRSSEASSAYSDAIAHQRATAMAVSNLDNALGISQRLLDKMEERYSEMTENFRLAFDRLTESNAENFDQKLRYAEFEAKQKRADMMVESLLTCVTPVVTIFMEKFGPKLLNMDPEKVQELVSVAKKATQPLTEPQAPSVPPALQGTTDVEQPTTTKPDSAISARAPEPEQRGVSSDGERGHQGNSKRAASKRSGAATRTTKTKGRKR